jgi:hypothetical protein
MMDYVRQAIEVAAAHPMGTVACAAAAILYLRLMLSGPRPY